RQDVMEGRASGPPVALPTDGQAPGSALAGEPRLVAGHQAEEALRLRGIGPEAILPASIEGALGVVAVHPPVSPNRGDLARAVLALGAERRVLLEAELGQGVRLERQIGDGRRLAATGRRGAERIADRRIVVDF